MTGRRDPPGAQPLQLGGRTPASADPPAPHAPARRLCASAGPAAATSLDRFPFYTSVPAKTRSVTAFEPQTPDSAIPSHLLPFPCSRLGSGLHEKGWSGLCPPVTSESGTNEETNVLVDPRKHQVPGGLGDGAFSLSSRVSPPARVTDAWIWAEHSASQLQAFSSPPPPHPHPQPRDHGAQSQLMGCSEVTCARQLMDRASVLPDGLGEGTADGR